MALNQRELEEVLHGISEQLTNMEFSEFTAMMDEKGYDRETLTAIAMKVAMLAEMQIDLRQWVLAFSIGFIVGKEAGYKEMGREAMK